MAEEKGKDKSKRKNTRLKINADFDKALRAIAPPLKKAKDTPKKD